MEAILEALPSRRDSSGGKSGGVVSSFGGGEPKARRDDYLQLEASAAAIP